VQTASAIHLTGKPAIQGSTIILTTRINARKSAQHRETLVQCYMEVLSYRRLLSGVNSLSMWARKAAFSVEADQPGHQ